MYDLNRYMNRLRSRPKTASCPKRFATLSEIQLQPIIARQNLANSLRIRGEYFGQAPGPDGLSFHDLSMAEWHARLRPVCTSLNHGTYRPGPTRDIEVPKLSGGFRRLTIRNLCDRAVSGAVLAAIERPLDTLLDDCCIGFRSDRNIHTVLARLATAVREGHAWIVHDDIRTAFDVVRTSEVIEVFRRRIPNGEVVELIAAILRGHRGADRTLGIDQGDPLSPLALNLYLAEVLDRPLLGVLGDAAYWRYADDLVFACTSRREGLELVEHARELLARAGLDLKSISGPVNLRRQGARITVLGFEAHLNQEHELVFDIPGEAWSDLDHRLAAAREEDYPSVAAGEITRGWIDAYGPAHRADQVESTVQHLAEVLVRNHFREGISRVQLRSWLTEAHVGWQHVVEPQRNQVQPS